MNKFTKKVNLDELYKEYTNIIKSMFKLTDRESELLSELIKLDSEKNRESNVASTKNRRRILNNISIHKDNLSRMISSFRRRGLLIKGPSADDLHVWKPIIPNIIHDRVQLTVILKLLENESRKKDIDDKSRNIGNIEESQLDNKDSL